MNSGLFKQDDKVSPVSNIILIFGATSLLVAHFLLTTSCLTFILILSAAQDEDQKVRVCAKHLRQYNDGMKLSNTIRMCDALSLLNKFQEEEMKKKTNPDEEQTIQITDTERFLFNLFKGIVVCTQE